MGENATSKPIDFVPMDVTMLAITFGIVIVVVLLFVLNKENQKNKIKQGVLEDEREEILDTEAPNTRVKKNSSSPKLQVRYYYKSFMKKAESEEQRIHRADTTDSIEEKYISKNNDVVRNTSAMNELDEVKKIYRTARYSNYEISKEDATKIKKLVRKA